MACPQKKGGSGLLEIEKFVKAGKFHELTRRMTAFETKLFNSKKAALRVRTRSSDDGADGAPIAKKMKLKKISLT